jgi:hypothetical protein
MAAGATGFGVLIAAGQLWLSRIPSKTAFEDSID